MQMANPELHGWFEENDGVVGVSELSSFIGESENEVRRYARENGMRRIGSTFVFTLEDAEAFLAEGDEEGDDDDDFDDSSDEVWDEADE